MSSAIITTDILNKIIEDNKQISNKCENLLEEIKDTKKECNFESVILDNNDPYQFSIIPKTQRVASTDIPESSTVQLNIGGSGSTEGSDKFKKILINDFLLLQNDNIYVKNTASKQLINVDAIHIQKVLDTLRNIDIKQSLSGENFFLNDNYHFISISSQKQIYLNQSKLIISLLIYIKYVESQLIQKSLTWESQQAGDLKCPTAGTFKNKNDSKEVTKEVTKEDLSNLTNQFDNVIANLDNDIVDCRSSIKEVQIILKDSNKKINQLWDSVLNEIAKSQKTFLSNRGSIEKSLKEFEQYGNDFTNFKSVTNTKIEDFQKNIKNTEDSLKNHLNDYSQQKVKVTELDKTSKLFDSKLKLLNNIVVDNSNNVKQLHSHHDKIIEQINNLKSTAAIDNQHFKNDLEEVRKNFEKSIENLNGNIKNISQQTMNLNNLNKQNNDTNNSQINMLLKKIDEIDNNQRHSVLSTNNRLSELTDNFEKHLNSTNLSLNKAQSNFHDLTEKFVKNNGEFSVSIGEKIESLQNDYNSSNSTIQSLRELLKHKDSQISTLTDNIDALNSKMSALEQTLVSQGSGSTAQKSISSSVQSSEIVDLKKQISGLQKSVIELQKTRNTGDKKGVKFLEKDLKDSNNKIKLTKNNLGMLPNNNGTDEVKLPEDQTSQSSTSSIKRVRRYVVAKPPHN
tara:strand:- start:775 stop:2814 length:2040 start_codon:yes stop_codon:yes gene_type:complete